MTLEPASDPHKPTVVLPDAVRLAKEFFAGQCAPAPLTYWRLLGAHESLERGVHVIRCAEACRRQHSEGA